MPTSISIRTDYSTGCLLRFNADGKLSQAGRPMERTETPKKRMLLAILAGVAFYVVFLGMAAFAIRDTIQSEGLSEADSISRVVGIVALVLAVLAWRKASRAGRRPWAWALGTFVSAGAAYISLWVLTPQRDPEKPDRLPGEDYEQYLRRVTRNTQSDASPAQVGAGNMEPEAELPPPPEPVPSPQLEVATTPAPASPAVERRSPRPRRAVPYAIGAAVALASVGTAWVVYSLVTRQSDDTTIAAVGSNPATGTPTPSLSPASPTTAIPPRAAAVVSSVFPQTSRGKRLTLHVSQLGNGLPTCSEGGFRVNGDMTIAYLFDCSNVAGGESDPYLMFVTLENRLDRAVRVSLRNFVVVAGDQDSQAPIDVTADADKPEALIPPSARIPPGASLKGWLFFDGKIPFVPRRLTYIDQAQTLAVDFEGTHRVFT